MKDLSSRMISSRVFQLALLALAVAAAVAGCRSAAKPVIALGELEFEELALAMEADMDDKHGCAGTETSISTPDASGYVFPDFAEGDSLPAELIDLYEREIHAIEHVDEWRIQGAAVVLLAHDLDDDLAEEGLFSTLTETVQLTGGSVGEARWEVRQVAAITECW